MSARFDCSDVVERALGIEAAATALRKGELVVLPTDTVYGLAGDAFDPVAVRCLLAAKGRGRQAPPPVLVGTLRAANALVEDFGAAGEDLIDEFWPGGLTLVCRARQSLVWDLGDTKGTVAVRMPLHQVALDLLKQTGPLAVSSANRTGIPAATTVAEAEAQLGEAVAVYLDGGPCAGDKPSTIVDLTGTVPRLLRDGVVPIGRLREVIALAVTRDPDDPPVVDPPVVDPPAVDPPALVDVDPPAADVEPPGLDVVEPPAPVDVEPPAVAAEPPAAAGDMPAVAPEAPAAGPAAPAAEAELAGVDEEASSG